MSDQVLSQRALNRATLERQLLLRRSTLTPVGAVEHLVGLQAQAPFSPYYQLWSRLDGFEPDQLGQAILDRAVVRIVVMRGTIHLLSAADSCTLRPLTQPIMDRDLRGNTQYTPGLDGLDLGELAAVAKELLAGTPLTNAEMGPILAERFPGHPAASLAYGARGLLALIQVPPRAVWGRSGQPRLTPVESWLGRELDPEPSIETMVLRYLGAFGPASAADAQVWSGLTRLREVMDRLRPQLRTFRDEDGKELFDLPDGPRPEPDTPAPPRLIPDFDNLIRSHANRTRVISADDMKWMNTRNGVTPNSLLVDGVVCGHWRVTRAKGVATLRIEPFRRLRTADVAAVEAEGRRLLAFAEAGVGTHDVEVIQPA